METNNKQKYSELFGELRNLLIEKKLNGTDWKYGIIMLTIAGFLYAIGIYFMPLFGPVLTVFYFSLLFVEMGYISHDIIHNQYFQSVRMNRAIAMIYANMGIGLSSSWWIEKHNVGHHNSTNSNIHDTDIRDYDEIFTGRVGKHPFFHKHKKVLFWIAPIFLYFNLLIESYKFLFRKKYFPEMLMNLLFLLFPTLLIIQFGAIIGIFVFLAIGVIVGMILGYVFMVNHIGLEIIDGLHIREYAWIDLQTRTSRNILGTRLTTEIFGGLDKQIEHHLFPQISRRKIRKVAKVVKEFCIANNLPYHEVSFFEGLSEIAHTLKTGETLNIGKSL
ncbi:MAG: hypothetical protein HHAS10_01290 [Candidatus Altimarinota bacterium]